MVVGAQVPARLHGPLADPNLNLPLISVRWPETTSSSETRDVMPTISTLACADESAAVVSSTSSMIGHRC